MNKLKILREEKKLSMREVASQLNIPYTTYVNYEKGLREPNSEMLIKLARYFNVSIDYLIGNSQQKNKPLVNNDEELTEYLEELKNRDELKMLFSLTKKATKSDVEKAVKIIETLLGDD